MPSPIIARADALMQRKRLGNTNLDDIPVLTDAVESDDADADDIPVLTEIALPLPAENTADIAAQSSILNLAAEPESCPPALDLALRGELVRELARRVEQRLSEELPRIIDSTVRDFLAEQEMITSLPKRD